MKIRMIRLGIKQSDMINLLAKNGIITDAPELSRALNERPQQRYQKLREGVNQILTEKENESNGL